MLIHGIPQGSATNAPIVIKDSVPVGLFVATLIYRPHGIDPVYAQRVGRHSNDGPMPQVSFEEGFIFFRMLPGTQYPVVGQRAGPVGGRDSCQRAEEGRLQHSRVKYEEECGSSQQYKRLGLHASRIIVLPGCFLLDPRCVSNLGNNGWSLRDI